jgi:hypothetical protein
MKEVPDMKKLLTAATVLVILLFSFGRAGADTSFIDDSPNGATTYYGGSILYNPNVKQDVIGASYDIAGMTITDSGGKVTVVLTGDYFTHYASLGSAGDLYISTTGWHTSDSPGDVHHSTDTFTSTEGWDYVVSAQAQKVYLLDNFSSGLGDIQWTNGSSYAAGRADQAWRGGWWYNDPAIENATVTLSGGALTFTFADLPGQPNADNWGFHWTMNCGNDVIEGQGKAVPEPVSLLLLGFIVPGLVVYRMRAVSKA